MEKNNGNTNTSNTFSSDSDLISCHFKSGGLIAGDGGARQAKEQKEMDKKEVFSLEWKQSKQAGKEKLNYHFKLFNLGEEIFLTLVTEEQGLGLPAVFTSLEFQHEGGLKLFKISPTEKENVWKFDELLKRDFKKTVMRVTRRRGDFIRQSEIFKQIGLKMV